MRLQTCQLQSPTQSLYIAQNGRLDIWGNKGRKKKDRVSSIILTVHRKKIFQFLQRNQASFSDTCSKNKKKEREKESLIWGFTHLRNDDEAVL